MIPRECATDQLDLPHTCVVTAAVTQGQLCECGRAPHDPIHEVVVAEKAATTPRFQTQKGS